MTKRPNILLITCDQYRFPRFSYGAAHGLAEGLKDVLGFQPLKPDNDYIQHFPGLEALRDNAVLLANHTIAASACTPSRTVIYTGQYGTRTGVTQTDGLFKSGDSPNFPWLAEGGIPTLGSWMREAGYTTHYFGKWHVSDPVRHSLEDFGFDDWEESWPEPHGAAINNLGLYRDAGFSDTACAFIRRQALAVNYDRAVATAQSHDPYASGPDPADLKPWFAVASFTNPHDIATYPAVIGQALPKPDDSGVQGIFQPLTVPLQGQATPPPNGGTALVPLNPGGFPQDCGHVPQTWDEDLSTKPSAQHDYAWKMGLALNSKTGFNVARGMGITDTDKALEAAADIALQGPIPFQLTDDPRGGVKAFVQLYGWLHSVVDVHIAAVLETLEATGQADNTIVVFLTDHGEMAGAHGMMLEKWHTAYQEVLHVPVVVRFPPALAPAGLPDGVPLAKDALTSHADIVPTILGLAGVGEAERDAIASVLAKTRSVPPLPGANLAPLIRGETDRVIEPDGGERQGVLFITDDEITAPSPPLNNPHNTKCEKEYAVFDAAVERVRKGNPLRAPVDIAPGSVRQPNHVRSVRTLTHKLTRYFDPSGRVGQEWEMYDLVADPNETTNLVYVQADPPKARLDPALQPEVDRLAALLAALEARDLS
jgi:arylsulfatase A-like enzyme